MTLNADPDADCQNTVATRSARHLEVTFVCKDEDAARTGRMVIDAADPAAGAPWRRQP